MSFVRNGEVSIHYEVVGNGPALILHTGSGGDLRIWREAGYLAGLSGFRVILVDQRGRGESSRPTRVEDYSMSRYVEDIASILDAVGVVSTGFWGYSLGAVVGLAFGAAFPRRLRALVGTGVVSFLNLDELPPILDRQAFISEVVAQGGVRGVVDQLMKEEQDRFPDPIDRNVRESDPYIDAIRRLAWRSWHGPKSLLPSFGAPVLLITGEKENVEGDNERVIAALPNGRMVRIPGTGHLGAFYRSDLALPIALPFLRDHLGEGG